MILTSNRLHWNQPKGERAAGLLALLALFQEPAGLDERKGSEKAETSTSSKGAGRFRSMKSRLFIVIDEGSALDVTAAAAAAAAAEQR